MDENEASGRAEGDASGVGDAEDIASAPGGCGECFPGLQAGSDEFGDFPGEVAGPDGTAAGVAAGRDRNAGRVSGLDAVPGLLKEFTGRSSARRVGKPADGGGGRELDAGSQGGQGGHEGGSVDGQDRGGVRVDDEAVLEGVDGRVGGEPAVGQAGGMRGDGRAAGVNGLDDAPYLVDGPRCDVRVGTVEVELDQVGTLVKLLAGGG